MVGLPSLDATKVRPCCLVWSRLLTIHSE